MASSESTVSRLITAADVADRLGVTRSFVYEHAHQLGAIRLGNGPRPRLRFDPETVARELRPEVHRRPLAPANKHPMKRRQIAPVASQSLLPIKHPEVR